MKVHAIASFDHYVEHLRPIFDALPDSLRGEFIHEHKVTRSHTKHWAPNDVVMVAGFGDVDAAFGRRCVYVEHGSGQSYVDSPNALASKHYHGAEHPENVIAYIGPRQDVIDAWGRPGCAAGAPVCDSYELFGDERTVAITFHWNAGAPNCVGVPEAGTAFERYAADMPHVISEFRANGWDVIGARHPRFNGMRGFWERHGVPEVTADEVRRRATLLVADSTSLMYEALYLARDVVALNAPWYRRDVEHGLRFWEHAPACQVDSAVELVDLIPHLDRIRDRGEFAARDIETTKYVYGKTFSDGHDGLRAATWLTSFLATI